MYTVIGCLGSVVAQGVSLGDAVVTVLKQVPISAKKVTAMRNALERLSVGRSYQVEYGGSGCTVTRSE